MTRCIVAASVFWINVSGAQKTIDNPAGGHIYLGALAGQLTPQEAFGKALHQVHVLCGDRPQPGQVVQGKTGEILAGFFTVTGKNQDGKAMAGLALVYVPKSGSAGAAVLMDYADRFPSTVNSMFATLKEQLGKKPAPAGGGSAATPATPTPAAPAQPLQRSVFPDGTGVIGLPAGWQMQSAHMGDVKASGPNGEKLRFGLTIPITSNGRAGGQFLSIPYGTDPANAYQAVITQAARKGDAPAPTVQVTKVQEIPMQGGKNYFLYGHIDQQFFVAQMINTLPQPMNTWQMTLFQITGPEKAMAEERATISAIFPSYSRDSRRVTSMANAQILEGIEQTNQFVNTVGQYVDRSDRMTAGMSDYLREQSVILDTETGGHARTSDQLADALIDANPNRFQRVPTSDYIRGIDY